MHEFPTFCSYALLCLQSDRLSGFIIDIIKEHEVLYRVQRCKVFLDYLPGIGRLDFYEFSFSDGSYSGLVIL